MNNIRIMIISLAVLGLLGESSAQTSYDQARSEFDAALANYNQAISNLQTARNLGALNRSAPPSTDRFGGVIRLLSAVAEPFATGDAEREVAIAREKLERAKALLNNIEPSWSPQNDFRPKNNQSAQAVLWNTYSKSALEAFYAGRFNEAEQLFKAAVPEAEKLASDGSTLGMTLFWLGTTCKAQSKTVEAEALFRRAAHIIESAAGFEGAAGELLYEIAMIEADKKNNATAKTLCLRAIEFHKKAKNRKTEFSRSLNLLGVLLAKDGDHKAAMRAFTESIACDPTYATAYQNRAISRTMVQDFAGGRDDYIKLAELTRSDRPAIWNQIAWLLSTSPHDQMRNGSTAVLYAEKAANASERTNPDFLDTLAAAYAEIGQFGKAVSALEDAIKLQTDAKRIAHYNRRLDLFRQNKPYRQAVGLTTAEKEYYARLSVEQLTAMAGQGDLKAQLILGESYMSGRRTPRNHTEAVRWLLRAAEQGLDIAQHNLGLCHTNGWGVPQNASEAAKWYRKAAEQGLASAQACLGFCYVKGDGVPQDAAEGAKWLREAAEQDVADAQYLLGVLYDDGVGVPQDPAEAVKWYRKAAEQGSTGAQTNLGWCFETGTGVPQDVSEAVKWYRKAAEQGEAKAQNSLGTCHANGLGVTLDASEAVKWYRKAAEQGLADAQNNLGTCYRSGIGMEQDAAEAIKWYRKASEQGSAPAQNNLGWCFETGTGVPQDVSEAVKWYRKAAEQGEANAQNNLGMCYEKGTGVPQDVTEAVKWYRKAADQGLAVAKSNLARMR